jgi:hypothetical protein
VTTVVLLLPPVRREAEMPQMPKEATRSSIKSLAAHVWAALRKRSNIETQTSHYNRPLAGKAFVVP